MDEAGPESVEVGDDEPDAGCVGTAAAVWVGDFDCDSRRKVSQSATSTTRETMAVRRKYFVCTKGGTLLAKDQPSICCSTNPCRFGKTGVDLECRTERRRIWIELARLDEFDRARERGEVLHTSRRATPPHRLFRLPMRLGIRKEGMSLARSGALATRVCLSRHRDAAVSVGLWAMPSLVSRRNEDWMVVLGPQEGQSRGCTVLWTTQAEIPAWYGRLFTR